MTAYRVVVLAVATELPEYVKMGTRGGPPRLGVAAPRHEVFLNGLFVQVLSTPSTSATPLKQALAMLLGCDDPLPVSTSYQGKAIRGLEHGIHKTHIGVTPDLPTHKGGGSTASDGIGWSPGVVAGTTPLAQCSFGGH